MIEFKLEGKKYLIETKNYSGNKRAAIQIYQETKEYGPDPFMTLSYNFEDSSEPEKGYFYSKYWSENKEFFWKMKRAGIISFHPKYDDDMWFGSKMSGISPIEVRITNEFLPEDEQFETDYIPYDKRLREAPIDEEDLPF